MGYTTDFNGSIQIEPALDETRTAYINLFNSTRRMKRNVDKLMELYNGKYGYPGIDIRYNVPQVIYGREGEYFVRDDGNMGQLADESIINYNTPPGQEEYNGVDEFNERWAKNAKKKKEGLCQPGLWCQWEIVDDGTTLQWDGGEKFYDYVEWLKYLIEHFFSKWDVLLNGEIGWEGEDPDDRGKIVVTDNKVKVKRVKITYVDEDEEE